MKIAIIGGGNMGSAIAEGILKSGVTSARDLHIVEQSPERRSELALQLKCSVAESSAGKEMAASDCIILAVKPQDFPSLAEALKAALNKNQLILSIMAGISTATISSLMKNHSKVVRCMPNMGALIGQGMNVYFADNKLEKKEKQLVEAIMGSIGQTLQVSDEYLIDAATAVSGSGPAYVFFVIEHMLEEAQELGFSQEESFQLVSQTFAGALNIWQTGKKSAADLRKMVTSKGGTTEAALAVFKDQQMDKIIRSGIKAAFDRAQGISKQ